MGKMTFEEGKSRLGRVDLPGQRVYASLGFIAPAVRDRLVSGIGGMWCSGFVPSICT